MSSPTITARSKLGVAVRTGDPEAAADARRELAAAKIEQFIRKTVDASPPLTADQLQRLAALLRPASGGGADAAA